MSSCPDNSTECLLRALLEVDSGFNWDLANLAITAIIGVLATGVTFIMLVQGIFTAGPGRLRGSPGAIGDFARFTQTRFSWSELRIRTKAKVPFLTYEEVMRYFLLATRSEGAWAPNVPRSSISPMSPDLLGDNHRTLDFRSVTWGWLLPAWRLTWTNIATAHSRFYQRALYGRHSALHSYAAGWAKLLAEFEDSITIYRPNVADGQLYSQLLDCDVDYGPSDLSAAPAMGSIEVLILLAVWAGCDRVVVDDNGYPVASGRFMQLSFRNHPQLGLSAVFDRFPGPGRGLLLATHVFHELGFVRFFQSDARFEDAEDEDGKSDKYLEQAYGKINHRAGFRLIFENPCWIRAIPYRSMGLRWAASRFARCSKAWRSLELEPVIKCFTDYAQMEGISICWDPVQHTSSSRIWPMEDKESFMEGRHWDAWWWEMRAEIHLIGSMLSFDAKINKVIHYSKDYVIVIMSLRSAPEARRNTDLARMKSSLNSLHTSF